MKSKRWYDTDRLIVTLQYLPLLQSYSLVSQTGTHNTKCTDQIVSWCNLNNGARIQASTIKMYTDIINVPQNMPSRFFKQDCFLVSSLLLCFITDHCKKITCLKKTHWNKTNWTLKWERWFWGYFVWALVELTLFCSSMTELSTSPTTHT